LSKGRKLDAWDLRALDVLVKGRGKYWFWEIDSWLDDRVGKFPKEPIFEEGRELFRARGLWKTDDDILRSMLDTLNTHVAKGGALTSAGRYMLEKLDEDAAHVLAIARSNAKKDRTSNIYDLLVAHRRPLFESLVPKLALKADSDKSYLAQVMLDADAKRYEKQAVALMRGLTDPVPALYSAKNLQTYFKGKYLPLVKELLVAAVKAKSASFIWENDAAGSREVAIELAWPALKEEAFDVWNAYQEENDALRADFCKTIEKQAKKKALPWLIDALVYPKDPKVEYGFLTHAKYVALILKILKPYDLKPYAERIEKAFAKSKDKKIRELVDPILGKAASKAKKKAPVRAMDGKKGYRFDAYADSVVKAALAAIAKNKKALPSPIENIKLAGMQGEIQLNALILEGVGEPVTFELSVPKTRVPSHCDFIEDDLLERFGKRHGLGEDEIPSWGDMYKLPWCALLHEQIGAAQAIAAGLKKHATLSKKCKVGVGEDDNFWESQASFARMAREEIAALPKEQQADFAALCFQDGKKQRWLVK